MTTRFTYVNIDLRHQYGISVTESQMFLLVKGPQRPGARKDGCFHRLVYGGQLNIFIELLLNFICQNTHPGDNMGQFPMKYLHFEQNMLTQACCHLERHFS